MDLLFKLALRNLIRNRVRSILNLLMIMGAFSSIVLFKGFSRDVLLDMETSVTHGQVGHVQIAKEAMWDGLSVKNKKDAYIEPALNLRSKLQSIPEIQTIGDRANAYVLLSNSNLSMGAEAIGFDPKVETQVKESLKLPASKDWFSGNNDYEVVVGMGIQKQLNLKVGQTITIVSQTLSGSMSSIDPEVRGFFSTGLTEADNSLIYMPVKAVQKLLGTDRIERQIIILKDGHDVPKVISDIKGLIGTASDLIAKGWKDVAVLYGQVSAFYETQNLFVEIILAVLVFLGILNTVGMSIYERIGEIGTMRALGDQQSQILGLLLLEGMLLGLIGAALGCFMASGLAALISSLEIEMLLPGQSQMSFLQVSPSIVDYLEASFLVCLTSVVSTLWPAQKALRLAITDALRANS